MSDMVTDYTLRPFTVEEYHRLADIGLLRPEERVELIDGAIVEMSPIGQNHWGSHLQIVSYLVRALTGAAEVAGQASLPLGTRDEPQPDVAVLALRAYKGGPSVEPEEIYAAIEIADSSLKKDIGPKLRLYARHRIADYLVVDLRGDVLLHHREPHDLGYRVCTTLRSGDVFTLTALPDIVLRADAFLD
ncbi:MAG: Uma2 family endonuclease [Vulcanimicrobiaceae bacterium]|jgi:Uma2 family endonuclease